MTGTQGLEGRGRQGGTKSQRGFLLRWPWDCASNSAVRGGATCSRFRTLICDTLTQGRRHGATGEIAAALVCLILTDGRLGFPKEKTVSLQKGMDARSENEREWENDSPKYIYTYIYRHTYVYIIDICVCLYICIHIVQNMFRKPFFFSFEWRVTVRAIKFIKPGPS